jgi:hypothetical protein
MHLTSWRNSEGHDARRRITYPCLQFELSSSLMELLQGFAAKNNNEKMPHK